MEPNQPDAAGRKQRMSSPSAATPGVVGGLFSSNFLCTNIIATSDEVAAAKVASSACIDQVLIGKCLLQGASPIQLYMRHWQLQNLCL